MLSVNTESWCVMKRCYRVVAGVMIKDDKILCGKRGKGFFESKWEFPGGKIELKETKTEALRREIKEELNCEIDRCVFFTTTEVEYSEFIIHMDTFLISTFAETPVSDIHQELKWEEIGNLCYYDWCDADRKVVSELMKYGADDLHDMLEANEMPM